MKTLLAIWRKFWELVRLVMEALVELFRMLFDFGDGESDDRSCDAG